MNSLFSFLLLVGIFFVPFCEGQITSLTIKNSEAESFENYPLTFGMVFASGVVGATSSVSCSFAGTELPTQVNVKTSYDDSSVRHALISVVIPQVPSNSSEVLTINLVNNRNNNEETGFLTKQDVIDLGVDSVFKINNVRNSGFNGESYESSFLNKLGQLEQNEINYWMKGRVCSEILLHDYFAGYLLNSKFEIRMYQGSPLMKISMIMENTNVNHRGRKDYELELEIDNQLVYENTMVNHTIVSRWRKVFWYNRNTNQVETTKMNNIEVRYDPKYLIDTKFLMNYNLSLQIEESRIVKYYDNWNNADNDIMENSLINVYFPTTGGRDEIGVLPTFSVIWLFTQDKRMKEIMLSNGDVSGHIPIHFREDDNNRTFFGKFVSVDDRPTTWLGSNDYWYNALIKAEDRYDKAIGPTDTIWSVDRAHQPDLVYIPYLITGDHYYLEELYYWAGFNIGASNYGYRDAEKGLIKDQVRGDAWAIRQVAHAFVLGPDADTMEKAYLKEKLNNNIEYWANEKSQNNPLSVWGSGSTLPGEGGRIYEPVLQDPPVIGRAASPWMDDFVCLILVHMYELNIPGVENVLSWSSKFLINRFSHDDFNWFNGADYRLPTHYVDSDGRSANAELLQTWKEVNKAIKKDYKLTEFSNTWAIGYPQVALGALAGLTQFDYPKVTKAYWFLHDNHHIPEANLLETPSWAFIPRITPSKYVDPAPYVTIISIAVFGTIFGLIFVFVLAFVFFFAFKNVFKKKKEDEN